MWSGVVWQALSGWIRFGTVRCVQAGTVGKVGFGGVWHGKVWQVRWGGVRQFAMRLALAGSVR